MVKICTVVTTLDTTNADQTDPANPREPACQIVTGAATCRGGTVDSCVSGTITPTIKHASWFRIRYCIHACCQVQVRFLLGYGISRPTSAFGSTTFNGWRNTATISLPANTGFSTGSVEDDLCQGGPRGGLDGSLTDVEEWMMHVSSENNCNDDSTVNVKLCMEWACSCEGIDSGSSVPLAEALCGRLVIT